MRPVFTRSSCRLLALVLAVSLVAPPAFADWGRPGPLPGISSWGETLRDALLIAGIAAGGSFLAYKLFGQDRADGVRSVPEKLQFERNAVVGELSLVNAGITPVRILSIELAKGDAFQIQPVTVPLPAVLGPQSTLAVRVALAADAAGTFEDSLVVSTRTGAADKVRVRKIHVRASGAANRAPALAEGRR